MHFPKRNNEQKRPGTINAATKRQNSKSQIRRAPLRIRLPAVEVRVIVKKTAPTSINRWRGEVKNYWMTGSTTFKPSEPTPASTS